jgi:dUTP pyrophosphatase
MSKGRLRLANSVGIIDAGYRGNLMSMFDLTTNISEDYIVNKYDKLIQICAPSLVPIIVEIVDTIDDLG